VILYALPNSDDMADFVEEEVSKALDLGQNGDKSVLFFFHESRRELIESSVYQYLNARLRGISINQFADYEEYWRREVARNSQPRLTEKQVKLIEVFEPIQEDEMPPEPWYIPIESAFGVVASMRMTEAYAELRIHVSREGFDIHHLVVWDEDNKRPIGVITANVLDRYIWEMRIKANGERTGHDSTVGTFTVGLRSMLRYSKDMSKDAVKQELTRPEKMAIFNIATSLFIVEEVKPNPDEETIVGFVPQGLLIV
jgi:hypothetical protein